MNGFQQKIARSTYLTALEASMVGWVWCSTNASGGHWG